MSTNDIQPTTVCGLLRAKTPDYVLRCYRGLRRRLRQRRNAALSRQEIFTEVYANNAWGGSPGAYYSGSGSVDPAATLPYVGTINSLIDRHKVTTVLDLGCGDFQIGRQLVSDNINYIGVDVVPSLIAFNQNEFGASNVRFQCNDIVTDELPDADMCLVRQVLQHLSNAEIAQIVGRLKRYAIVVVTEHFPSSECVLVANIDKPHGADIRIDENSAVVLDAAPFNVENVELILEVPATTWLVQPGETLRTYMIRNRVEFDYARTEGEN